MKKKLITIMIVGMLSLTGCATTVESVNDNAPKQTSMFVEVESTSLWKVVYNRETKVMYTVSWGSYNSGTFTLLVNPDGTPMLWEEN